MAFFFSANQYEEPFTAKRMQQYQVPHRYREHPRRRSGFTRIMTDNKGHMNMGVQRSMENPWGNFVGTWDLPIHPHVPGNHVFNDMGRTPDHCNMLRREKTDFDTQMRAKAVRPLRPWSPKEPGKLYYKDNHQEFRDKYQLEKWDCDEKEDKVANAVGRETSQSAEPEKEGGEELVE